MLLDFPGLSSDQRNSILKVLACAGEVEPNPSFQFLDHDVISIPLDDDLVSYFVTPFNVITDCIFLK